MLHQAPHSFTKKNSRNPLVYASGMPKPAFLSLQEWSLSTKKKHKKLESEKMGSWTASSQIGFMFRK